MNKDNVKLAIAPIGWTNDDMPELGSENTFQQIVSEMALAGFTGSEVGSKYPRDPAVLKPMLDIRGIQICNARFSTFFANGRREKTIDEFDKFMSLVDERVFLLFDTGHAWYSEGGEAPMLAILKKYLPRINHVHLKDVRPPVIDQVRRDGLSFLDGVKKGTFTVPGDGVIDFRPVFKLLDDFGYKGWMVVEAEQDPALANPFEYAVKARKYIRETAGI